MHIRQISILAAIAGLTALGGLAAPGPAMATTRAPAKTSYCGTMTNMADPPLVISGVNYNSSHSNTGNRIVTVPVGITIEGASADFIWTDHGSYWTATCPFTGSEGDTLTRAGG